MGQVLLAQYKGPAASSLGHGNEPLYTNLEISCPNQDRVARSDHWYLSMITRPEDYTDETHSYQHNNVIREHICAVEELPVISQF